MRSHKTRHFHNPQLPEKLNDPSFEPDSSDSTRNQTFIDRSGFLLFYGPTFMKTSLLFSAHISYGKGKYFNQTGFFFTKFAMHQIYIQL